MDERLTRVLETRANDSTDSRLYRLSTLLANAFCLLLTASCSFAASPQLQDLVRLPAPWRVGSEEYKENAVLAAVPAGRQVLAITGHLDEFKGNRLGYRLVCFDTAKKRVRWQYVSPFSQDPNPRRPLLNPATLSTDGAERVFITQGAWLFVLSMREGRVVERYGFPDEIEKIDKVNESTSQQGTGERGQGWRVTTSSGDASFVYRRGTLDRPSFPSSVGVTPTLLSSDLLFNYHEATAVFPEFSEHLAAISYQPPSISHQLSAIIHHPSAISHQAERAYLRAVSQDASNPWLFFYLGHALRLQGTGGRGQGTGMAAEDAFAQALSNPYGTFADFKRMGLLFDLLGMPRHADRAFERAYALFLKSGYEPRQINTFSFDLMTGSLGKGAAAQFCNGNFMRAFEDLEWRRAFCPFIEGDYLFGLAFTRWLEGKGWFGQAAAERARLRKLKQSSFFALRSGETGGRHFVDQALFLLMAMGVSYLIFLLTFLTGQGRGERGEGWWVLVGFYAVWLLTAHLMRARLYPSVELYRWRMPYFYDYGNPETVRWLERSRSSVGVTPTLRHPDVDFLLAYAYHRAGELNKAAQIYQEVLKQRKDAAALNNLGVIFFKEGRTDGARQCFERAAALDEKLCAAHYNLGTFFSDTWHRKKAESLDGQAVFLQDSFREGEPMLASFSDEQWKTLVTLRVKRLHLQRCPNFVRRALCLLLPFSDTLPLLQELLGNPFAKVPIYLWLLEAVLPLMAVVSIFGFKASKLQGFKASRLQGFKASRLQGFKASRLQGFKALRLAGHWSLVTACLLVPGLSQLMRKKTLGGLLLMTALFYAIFFMAFWKASLSRKGATGLFSAAIFSHFEANQAFPTGVTSDELQVGSGGSDGGVGKPVGLALLLEVSSAGHYLIERTPILQSERELFLDPFSRGMLTAVPLLLAAVYLFNTASFLKLSEPQRR